MSEKNQSSEMAKKLNVCTCEEPDVFVNERNIAICKKCGGTC